MASKQTTPEQNVALMRRVVIECQGGGNFDLLPSYVHPDFVNLTPMGDIPNNREGVFMTMKFLHTAFEDIEMEIIQCIGQGNVVATNKVLRGRQVADFAGVPASGKRVEFPIMDFVTFEDGMAKEHWARGGPLKELE